MKRVKAVILVIFFVAIFLCARVYLHEPVPRVVDVPQRERSGAKFAAKVDNKTGTGTGMSVSARTYCVCRFPMWYIHNWLTG